MNIPQFNKGDKVIILDGKYSGSVGTITKVNNTNRLFLYDVHAETEEGPVALSGMNEDSLEYDDLVEQPKYKVGDIVETFPNFNGRIISLRWGTYNGKKEWGYVVRDSHLKERLRAESDIKGIRPLPKSDTIVTKEQVEANMQDVICRTEVEFGKPVTYVSVRMINGFVIRESSSCVDPANYDEEYGKRICLEKIEDKIWYLLGYALQDKVYKQSLNK